jgi:hypothetical protein
VRLLHAVAFSKKLRWLAQNMVITLKTQALNSDATVVFSMRLLHAFVFSKK